MCPPPPPDWPPVDSWLPPEELPEPVLGSTMVWTTSVTQSSPFCTAGGLQGAHSNRVAGTILGTLTSGSAALSCCEVAAAGATSDFAGAEARL